MRLFVLILSALLPLATLVLLFPDTVLWVAERAGLAEGLPAGPDLEAVLSDCQVRDTPGADLVCPSHLPATAFAPVLRGLLVQSEDRRFRSHAGVDWRATAVSLPGFVWHGIRVMLHAVGEGEAAGGLRGASTLTQQVARLLVAGSERTLRRKLREMILAERIEQARDKEMIETLYLNTAPLSAGSVGFDEAARRLFGRPAADLDAAQAALLVGELPAPTARDPRDLAKQPKAEAAARRVLRKGLDAHVLTAATYASALAGLGRAERLAEQPREPEEPVELRPYLDLARAEVGRDVPRDTDRRLLLHLDPRLQDRVGREARAIAGPFAASGLFMRPNGQIVAVGTSDYLAEQYDPAFRAARSIGSLGKILVLIGGHASGQLSGSFPFLARDPDAFPRDHDPACLGWVGFTVALAKSCNKAFAHAAERIGPPLASTVQSFGFAPPNDLRQVATGGVQSNLLGVARMLAGLAGGGLLPKPSALAGVLGPDGTVLQREAAPAVNRAIPPSVAQAVVRDLRIPVDPAHGGTGVKANSRFALVWGKTGTSADNRDAWFAGGVTGARGATVLVGGFWIGANDDRPMAGMVGGGGPAEAFRTVADQVARAGAVESAPRLTALDWFDTTTANLAEGTETVLFALLRFCLVVGAALLSLGLIRWVRPVPPAVLDGAAP